MGNDILPVSKETKLIREAELENKDLPEVQQLLAISFEYLLAGVAEAYSMSKGYKNLQEFNDKNELTWNQILVYPFFIALSNGHSRSLYALFGRFLAYSFGPASISTYEIIKSGKASLKEFVIDTKQAPITVKVSNPSQTNNFGKLKEAIRDREVIFEGEKVPYKQVYIEMNDPNVRKPISQAIDTGIEIIQKQSNESFFAANLDDILFHASYFPSFWRLYRQSKVSVLKYDDVKLSRRPFYEKAPWESEVPELI